LDWELVQNQAKKNLHLTSVGYAIGPKCELATQLIEFEFLILIEFLMKNIGQNSISPTS
jgi:hypothetical protein